MVSLDTHDAACRINSDAFASVGVVSSFLSRGARENQLYEIMLKRNGVDTILSIYMKTMGLDIGTKLPAGLTRNSMVSEILDFEYSSEVRD